MIYLNKHQIEIALEHIYWYIIPLVKANIAKNNFEKNSWWKLTN